jgi:hypothetical protein
MTRWFKHWQSLPRRNRLGAALSLVVLIVCLVALAVQISHLVRGM